MKHLGTGIARLLGHCYKGCHWQPAELSISWHLKHPSGTGGDITWCIYLKGVFMLPLRKRTSYGNKISFQKIYIQIYLIFLCKYY